VARLLAKNHDIESQLGEQQALIIEHHDTIAMLQNAAKSYETEIEQQQNSINVLVEEVGRLRLRLGTGKSTKPTPKPTVATTGNSNTVRRRQ